MSREHAKKFYELARDDQSVHHAVEAFQHGVLAYAKNVHKLDFTYDELMDHLKGVWGADFEADNPDKGNPQTCSCFSDRNLKEEFTEVDTRDVLGRLMSLEVSRWKYRGEDPSVRHIGPMAQDFAAAFELGQSDRMINLMDASGVTMAALQALCELDREKDTEIQALRRDVDALRAQIEGAS